MRLPAFRRPFARDRHRAVRNVRKCVPALLDLEERSLLSLTIQLNYSLDTSNFFNTPAKKALLQLAANSVAADISANLSAIVPTGGDTWSATVGDPRIGFDETFNNLTIPANTVVIYVKGAALPGTITAGEAGDGISGGFSAMSADQNWLNTVSGRGLPGALGATPTAYATWGGAILFDNSNTNWFFGTTTAGITAAQTDFLTVAEHEIGHVLGIGTSDVWFADVNTHNATFTGKTAESVEGGNPVPVDPASNGEHWAEGTVSDNRFATMTPVLLDGTRLAFSTLDYAGLNDLGWQLQAPVLQFGPSSSPSVNAVEGDSSVTLTVTRTGGTGPATVNYTTVNGTAKAGTDYTTATGTLNFAVGQMSATITVPLLKNTAATGTPEFSVKLSDPTEYAKLGSATATTVHIETTIPPSKPVLAPESDTGISSTDGITQNNGTTAAPLKFTVSGVSPANGFVRLFNGNQLLAGPVQATGGVATLTIANATPLADGVYAVTATSSPTSTAGQSGPSTARTVTIQTSLKVVGVSPTVNNYTSLPGGQVVVTFNHPLVGLTANDPTGGGFASNPFAVYLVPRGPDGVFAAPSGVDGGTTPMHSTLVYSVNADGTSTIKLKPQEPLGTDVYLIVASGTLTDLAGNTLLSADGKTPGSYYSTFLLRTTPPNGAPLKVTSVTTLHGTVNIANNASILQPDTIAIAFNKPVNFLTTTTSTVQLLGPSNAPVAAAVAYSPSTQTLYLTPEAILGPPGTTYTIRVDRSVTDDQAFPNPDPAFTLGTTFTRSFRVSTAGIGAGTSPLKIVKNGSGQLAISPGPGTIKSPVGYASINFSEPLNLSKFGRYTVQLSLAAGGLNPNAFDAADAALNAKIAFNPNTGSLIMVPTVPLVSGNYLFTIGKVPASNGDSLNGPTYSGFTLALGSSPAVRPPRTSPDLFSVGSIFRPSLSDSSDIVIQALAQANGLQPPSELGTVVVTTPPTQSSPRWLSTLGELNG